MRESLFVPGFYFLIGLALSALLIFIFFVAIEIGLFLVRRIKGRKWPGPSGRLWKWYPFALPTLALAFVVWIFCFPAHRWKFVSPDRAFHVRVRVYNTTSDFETLRVVTTLTDRKSRRVIGKESFRARDLLFWGFDGGGPPYPPFEVEWLDGPDRVAVKFEGICLIVLLPSGKITDSRPDL